jgi:hypothetical protein
MTFPCYLTKCILLEVRQVCTSPASTFCTHGAIVKLVQVIRSRRPSLGTSTLWTEVRVRSRWPVAMRRALSAYSVILLICVLSYEHDVRLFRCKTLRLDVM